MIEISKKRKIFKCKVCGDDKLAEHFANSLNKFPVRDLRLVCCQCASSFNKLPLESRRQFLKEEIDGFYGEEQYIYALCEPETEIIRYVGRTNHPQTRFNHHLQKTRDFSNQICIYTNKPKYTCDCEMHKRFNETLDTKRWIIKLLTDNKKPVMKVLEKVKPGRMIHEREVRNICQFIKEDYKLLNYENQSKNARKMIKAQNFSFMHVDIEELESSGFLRNLEIHLSFDVSHESGWRRALLLHRIFSTNTDLKFNELNFYNKDS